MDKVEEIYLAENKSEKVAEFLHILQTFNQSTDKVEELYYVRRSFFLVDSFVRSLHSRNSIKKITRI